MKTTTFYSYKGGVGRTAALVNASVEMARRGRDVLVMDMDLEAPGLDTWLPPRGGDRSYHGLLELISHAVDEGSLPRDLERYVYEPALPWTPTGRLLVLPAGHPGEDYARKLGSVPWHAFFHRMSGSGFFRLLKDRLRETYALDRLLVDARTGFTDPSAVAVRSLADLVVLVFRPDTQNIRGLSLVLSDFRRDRAPLGSLEDRYLLVASQLLQGSPGSSEEARLQERLLQAAESLSLLPGSENAEDEPLEEDWLEVVDRHIQRIHWQRELASIEHPVIQKNRETPWSLEYHKLTDEIETRLASLDAAEEGVPKRAARSWSPRARREVILQDLGDFDGARDPRLDDAFVDTEMARRAFQEDVAFVVGNKGAGKSAIFRKMVEGSPRIPSDPRRDDIISIPVHGEVKGLTLLGDEDLPPPRGTEEQEREVEAYRRFWHAYIASRLSSFADTEDPIDGRELHTLRNEVRELQDRDSREWFDIFARSALEKAGNRTVLLMIDASERLFRERPLEQATSFRGLASTYLDWRDAVPRLRFKVFVRDQALLEPSGTVVDRSHLRGRIADLKWEETDTWWFLLRRLLGGLPHETVLPPDIPDDLLHRLRTETAPGRDKTSLDTLRNALETVFPTKVYPGENEAPFHRWLVDRVVDGHGAVYPRVLLGFAKVCQRLERKADPEAERNEVFDRVRVREAFREASREHAKYYFDELGFLRPYLEAFSDPPFGPHQVRYTRREIEEAFEKVWKDRRPKVSPEVAAKVLVYLGILREQSGRWRGQAYDYEIPHVYKFELVRSPKGRI